MSMETFFIWSMQYMDLNTCRACVWMHKYKSSEGRGNSASFIVSYSFLQWSMKVEGSLFLLRITRSNLSSVKTKAVERTCRGYIRDMDWNPMCDSLIPLGLQSQLISYIRITFLWMLFVIQLLRCSANAYFKISYERSQLILVLSW